VKPARAAPANPGQRTAGWLARMRYSRLQSAAMVEESLPDESARQALRSTAAALDEAQARARPAEMCQALLAMARAYRDVRSWAGAEACADRALRWSRMTGSVDQVVEVLCELCEITAHLADALEARRTGSGHAALERARDHVFEASTLAGTVADPGWEFKVLLRISDVLDRCGDRDDAVQLQTRALRLMSGNLAGTPIDPSVLPSLGRLADT